MEARIDPRDRARFHHEGLLVIPDQFGAAELATLRQSFDRLRHRAADLATTTVRDGALFVIDATGADDRPRVQRVVWCGAAEAALARAGLDQRILNRAADLMGVDVVDQLVNQAHFKEPGDGVTFPLHQDAWNRRYGTELWQDRSPDGAYVQVVLTIDEMTEDNGPLLYIPGSHRRGPLVGDDRKEKVAAYARAFPPVPVVAPAGALVFFGPFLIHGSRPNRGTQTRRVLVNGFARSGVNRRRYHGADTGVRRLVVD